MGEYGHRQPSSVLKETLYKETLYVVLLAVVIAAVVVVVYHQPQPENVIIPAKLNYDSIKFSNHNDIMAVAQAEGFSSIKEQEQFTKIVGDNYIFLLENGFSEEHAKKMSLIYGEKEALKKRYGDEFVGISPLSGVAYFAEYPSGIEKLSLPRDIVILN